jgi:hypothetical protein
MFGRSILMSVLSAVLVSGAAPALAEVPEAGAERDAVALAEKGDKADKRFPMPADKFKQGVEKRISKARGKLTAHLDKKKVSKEERDRILARFDRGAAEVRAAADKACKDGTVTLEEAKAVREVAKRERKEMRGQVAKNGKKGDKKKRA